MKNDQITIVQDIEMQQKDDFQSKAPQPQQYQDIQLINFKDALNNLQREITNTHNKIHDKKLDLAIGRLFISQKQINKVYALYMEIVNNFMKTLEQIQMQSKYTIALFNQNKDIANKIKNEKFDNAFILSLCYLTALFGESQYLYNLQFHQIPFDFVKQYKVETRKLATQFLSNDIKLYQNEKDLNSDTSYLISCIARSIQEQYKDQTNKALKNNIKNGILTFLNVFAMVGIFFGEELLPLCAVILVFIMPRNIYTAYRKVFVDCNYFPSNYSRGNSNINSFINGLDQGVLQYYKFIFDTVIPFFDKLLEIKTNIMEQIVTKEELKEGNMLSQIINYKTGAFSSNPQLQNKMSSAFLSEINELKKTQGREQVIEHYGNVYGSLMLCNEQKLILGNLNNWDTIKEYLDDGKKFISPQDQEFLTKRKQYFEKLAKELPKDKNEEKGQQI